MSVGNEDARAHTSGWRAWAIGAGRGRAAAAEAWKSLPPSWVPAFPPRLEPVRARGAPRRAMAAAARDPAPVRLGALLSAAGGGLRDARAARPSSSLERLVGVRTAARGRATARQRAARPRHRPPLPTLRAVSQDAAGSSIDGASYPSAALHGDRLIPRLSPRRIREHHQPLPGAVSADRQRPVGHGVSADRAAGPARQLIAQHAIPPLIAVMIQGGPGTNNWRNKGAPALRKLHPRNPAADRPHAADDRQRATPARSSATRWAATAR